MAAPRKEACVIILDVGYSMCEIMGDTNHSGLDNAKQALRLMIQQKLLFTKQDEMGLIVVGSDETDNPLNDQDKHSYKHIKVLRDLSKPDLKLLELIDEIQPENSKHGDVIDALLVAMSIIHNRVKKLKFAKRIFLVTDAGAPILDDPQALQSIENGMKIENFKLNIIGINFTKDDEDEDIDEDDSEKLINKNIDNNNNNNNTNVDGHEIKVKTESGNFIDNSNNNNNSKIGNDRTDIQIFNEKLLREFCRSVDGVVFNVHTAIDMLSIFRSRSINQVTKYRGPLEIGGISINVYTYGKTAMQNMPSLKKLVDNNNAIRSSNNNNNNNNNDNEDEEGVDGMDSSGAIKMERTYINKLGEVEKEVAADMIIKSYRYGKDQVPFTEEDLLALKYECDKTLKVLAFVDEQQIKRHTFMSNVDAVVAEPGNISSGRALSAFIHALFETQKVAIVRYVKRKNAQPLLGVLMPEITTAYECLYFNQLPFQEDIRDFTFAGFSLNDTFKVNNEQLLAAKNLIKSMNLMNALHENGESIEALKPIHTYNPVLQHFYQCVERRALDPSADIKELDPNIAKYITPDPQLLINAKPVYQKFKQLFPLQKIEKEKKQKRHWRDYYDTNIELDPDIAAIKKNKPDNADNDNNNIANNDNDMSGEIEFDNITSRIVDKVGTVEPVKDFNAMLARRDDPNIIQRAIDQMQSLIKESILSSYQDTLFPGAIESLKALRKGCVQHEEAETFNNYLVGLRVLCSKKKESFIRYMRDNNILPIDTSEVADSKYSVSEAKNFYSDNSISLSVTDSVPNNNNNNAEDIFDSME